MKTTISKMKKQVQRGFTLVEIAIVLVIIGLLIGGVLRGQELINSARVNSINSQQQSVQTAYYAFIDRYKFLPGDITAAQAATISRTAAPAGASGDGGVAITDSAAFFNNLTTAGFLSCTPCTSAAVVTPGAAGVGGTYIPPATLSGSNTMVNVYGSPLVFIYDVVNGIGTNVPGQNIFLSSAGEAPKPQVTTGGTLTSSMLAEIDRKVDDGSPAGGTFRFTDIQGTAGTGLGAAGVGAFGSAANSPLCATIVTWVTNPPSSTCQGASIF
jgi:prepilin-type N-terminal cleavage/methylation domain-containing protein